MAAFLKPIRLIIQLALLLMVVILNAQLIPDLQPEPFFPTPVSIPTVAGIPTTQWTPTDPTFAPAKPPATSSTVLRCRKPACLCMYDDALLRYNNQCDGQWWCGVKPRKSDFCDVTWMLENHENTGHQMELWQENLIAFAIIIVATGFVIGCGVLIG